MAIDEAERLIETQRIRARFVRRQLHEAAAAFAAPFDCPLDHPSTDAAAANMACNPHAFDLPAPHAQPGQAGYEAALHAADDLATLFHDSQKLARIGV